MKKFTRIEPTHVHTIGEHFKRSMVIKRFKTDDGNEHEFTTFHSEDIRSTAVIALTDDNHVIISRQFRPGRERYIYDLPGGGLEPGEEPQIGASRELLEETGYKAGDMEYLGMYSWDAYSNLETYYFFATGCRRADTWEPEQIEVDQGMEVVLVTIEQLIEYAKKDETSDAAAVLMAYDKLISLNNK